MSLLIFWIVLKEVLFVNKLYMIINNTRAVKIGIVAGEASGDIIGVGLIKSLKKQLKNVHFFGIGGFNMQSENMECWYDISDFSVMGVTELILKLPRLVNIRRKIVSRFVNLKLDVFIGIDFPDFNVVLEKRLKKKGIYTIHYVSPAIWAWRSSRILDFKQAINNILVLFPFEKPIYDCVGIPCKFIGHTLADQIPLYPNKNLMRRKLGISKNKNCLALLPGSRIQEVKMLTNKFIVCAELLHNNIPDLEVLIPLNSQELIKKFAKLIPSISLKYRIFHTHKAWEILIASDFALLASGTVTLECMLAKCPMVVAYRIHPITYFLIKKLIKIPWISLPNILSGYNLIQEYIQKDCNPSNLFKALNAIFNLSCKQRKELKRKFLDLHKLIKLNADDQAAQTVLDCIKF